MTTLNKSLAQIRREIKTEIESALNTAIQSGNVLEEVNQIVYSDKIRSGALNLPIIWIIPSPHTPQITGVRSEMHDFSFYFVALTKNADIESGKEQAEDITAKIYDLFMSDRTLNGTVHDILPGRFDPAYQRAEARQIYWASCELRFRVKKLTN